MDEHQAARLCAQLIPEFAPLPKPFLSHLLQQNASYLSNRYLPLKKTQQPEEAVLETLWQQFIYFRSVTYSYIAPFSFAEDIARDTRMSSIWLQQALTQAHPPGPSIKTISDWHIRHLLHYRAYDVPDPNAAAALLILRHMLTKSRGWLPSLMDEGEPLFWVWGALPRSAPIAYPISCIDTLPPHTLLWSPWPGAAFDRSWLLLPARGALRWAGTTVVNGLSLWNLSLEEIQLWQTPSSLDLQTLEDLEKRTSHFPHLVETSRPDLNKVFLHLVAEELLRRIGIPLLISHLDRFYGENAPTLFTIFYSLDKGGSCDSISSL